jgi:DNA helicase-2/ATP-dependent DNA helicase PcrA
VSTQAGTEQWQKNLTAAMGNFDPTPEQEVILGYEPGHHARVLAGPGTGKSATVVALIDQLLENVPAPRVRLLTFTRAATGELAQKVSEHPAVTTERPSTIHSFAISVLLRNPGAADFPEPLRMADDWEYANLVRPTLARRAGVTVTELDRLIREMAAAWESLAPGEDARVSPEARARFLGAWDEHRRIYGYTLLAELPYALRQALIDHPDLEGIDYDLLVVDEYQDLNACDLEALHLLAERGCSVIGAGDDDQSIYSFRKAAPQGIRRFLNDYPGADDFTLSVSQRCGSAIIDWAMFVIEGDPDRPHRPRLHAAEDAPPGEVALLAFDGHVAEARGVAALVQALIEEERVPAGQILVLLRSDFNNHFSRLIELQLHDLGIECSDPEAIENLLAEPDNRWLLAAFRLLVNRDDSLAWASLLRLRTGIGESFATYIYDRARAARTQFGSALLAAYNEGFDGAPAAPAGRATSLIQSMIAWLDQIEVPEDDGTQWGSWIVQTSGGPIVPEPTEALQELLLALDETAEPKQDLGRYLGQVAPLGKDRGLAQSDCVRIMTMGGAKGLTVQAAIVAALEDEIIPRQEPPLDEERRLLYVALTRARQHVFGTWARRRTGPTARVGGGQAVTRRSLTRFLRDGPVTSEDGATFIQRRW